MRKGSRSEPKVWCCSDHRIMVHVQSSWFPLIDRNPQTYVPNIFEAKDSDFKPARMKVYRARNAASYVQVDVVGSEPIRP